jgi:hypothetical protein
VTRRLRAYPVSFLLAAVTFVSGVRAVVEIVA